MLVVVIIIGDLVLFSSGVLCLDFLSLFINFYISFVINVGVIVYGCGGNGGSNVVGVVGGNVINNGIGICLCIMNNGVIVGGGGGGGGGNRGKLIFGGGGGCLFGVGGFFFYMSFGVIVGIIFVSGKGFVGEGFFSVYIGGLGGNVGVVGGRCNI